MILKSVLGALNLNVLGVISLAIALIGFVAVLLWTFTRSGAQMEADARLWMDDEQ